jgi:hypothetical protein
MSRGVGRVQRHILEALAGGDWLTVEQLARRREPEPSRAVVESTRRAVKQLNRAGGVDLEEHVDFDRPVRGSLVLWAGEGYLWRRAHSSSRVVLAAHLPLSVEEKAAREHSWRSRLEALAAIEARIRTASA